MFVCCAGAMLGLETAAKVEVVSVLEPLPQPPPDAPSPELASCEAFEGASASSQTTTSQSGPRVDLQNLVTRSKRSRSLSRQLTTETSRSQNRSAYSTPTSGASSASRCMSRKNSTTSLRSWQAWDPHVEEKAYPFEVGQAVKFRGFEGVSVRRLSKDATGELMSLTVNVPGIGEEETTVPDLLLKYQNQVRNELRFNQPACFTREERMHGMFTDFVDEAASGILLDMLDPETLLSSETMFRIDEKWERVTFQSAFAECLVFGTRELTSVFMGEPAFEKRVPAVKPRGTRCVGLEFGPPSRLVVLQFKSSAESAELCTCFKILKQVLRSRG